MPDKEKNNTSSCLSPVVLLLVLYCWNFLKTLWRKEHKIHNLFKLCPLFKLLLDEVHFAVH